MTFVNCRLYSFLIYHHSFSVVFK